MQCLLKMRAGPEARAAERFARRWAHWSAVDDVAGHVALTSQRATGGARTVFGMVAGNEPLRTAPRLSSALAAASATGAFGIFYSSIWAMSTYLSTPRLLGIGAVAIVLMTAWLIIRSSAVIRRPGRTLASPGSAPRWASSPAHSAPASIAARTCAG